VSRTDWSFNQSINQSNRILVIWLLDRRRTDRAMTSGVDLGGIKARWFPHAQHSGLSTSSV
jgi:hypothetical protein